MKGIGIFQSMPDSKQANCTLCQEPLRTHFIVDQTLHFCCSGCQAVFNILSAKGEMANYQSSPLFMQAIRSGLISNPALLERIRDKSSQLSQEEILRFYFRIDEMWCPSCAEVIRLVLMQERGIKSCHVDYATDMASLEFAPKLTSKETIFNKIKSLGYVPGTLEQNDQTAISKTLYLRCIIAAFCAFNSMMFAYPLYATYFDRHAEGYNHFFAWLLFFISLPAVCYTGWPIFRRFWTSLIVGLVGMEALVTIGVLAAFFLSSIELFAGSTYVYFDSMSVIVAFVLLGKIIENKAKLSAKEALFRLNLSLPKRGRKLLEDGSTAYVPIKELKKGDLIEARMGELIVLDGIVTEGEGICNEALMTGEAIPTTKIAGSRVIGGTLLQHGRLAIKVAAEAASSTIQHIVDIIEQQISLKQAYVRPADAIVYWFVPSVISLALLTAIACFAFEIADEGRTIYQTAFVRAISILLISCPCAIGIAAPLAESALIQALAARGVIVRNRACLRYLGAETAMLFDKTGTITQGSFKVLHGLDNFTTVEQQVLKGMVEKSNHPIAQAINAAIEYAPARLTTSEEFAGKGIQAIFRGDHYYLGSKKWMDSLLSQCPELHVSQAIATTVYFAKNGEKAKMITLGDELKPDAKQAIQELEGVEKHLVSGDGSSCVAYVASLCGFQDYLAQASPLDKQQYIDKLKQQGHIVAMIGDGINDSPALASSHVGISVLTATDVSIQVSDILLTTDKLNTLNEIRALASKGRRILKQNLFWAFFYNIIGIGLALFGWLSPIFAAFAMTASSLIVLFNARRIK